ncbi:MAG: T9SS type A sorting domain-containing protein [Flammeovirgaceae bacterium]
MQISFRLTGTQALRNGRQVACSRACGRLASDGLDDCTGEFSAEQPLVITGIEAIDLPIDLYPNPVSGVLTIYFGDLAGNKQVTIFTLTGQELISTKTKSGSISINVSDLSAGDMPSKGNCWSRSSNKEV